MLKYRSRRIMAFFMSLLLCLFFISTASGAALASGSLELDDDYGEPIWRHSNLTVYSNTITSIVDLFGLATKNLMPGESRALDIRLENRNNVPYNFYLNAAARVGTAAKEMEDFFPDKKADDSLLDVISVLVSYSANDSNTAERDIYSGFLIGAADAEMYSANGILLGTIAPNSFGTIRVNLNIPHNLDNNYMDTLCAVDWWFTALSVEPDDSDPGGSDPGGTDSPTPTTPTTPVTPTTPAATDEDDDTEPDDEVTIVNPDTPLAEIDIDTEPDDLLEVDDTEIPLAPVFPDVILVVDSDSSWALLNLILTAIIGVCTIILATMYISDRSERSNDTISQRKKYKGIASLLSLVPVAASVILFILTTDLSAPMTLVNNLTIWFGAIAAVQLLLVLSTTLKRNEQVA